MKAADILAFYKQDERTKALIEDCRSPERLTIQLKGLHGSAGAMVAAAVFESHPFTQIVILTDKETAAYFFNDAENLCGEQDLSYEKRHILFFPSSYKKSFDLENIDHNNVLMRTEVLNKLQSSDKKSLVVTYPEAISEKVITKATLTKNTFRLKKGEQVSIEFITEFFAEFDFEHTDFVIEPGQFSVRGGIVDVFSFSGDYPYRIEFTGNSVSSIRSFDPQTQLSIDKLSQIQIIPDISKDHSEEKRESFFNYISPSTVCWFDDFGFTTDIIQREFEKIEKFLSEGKNNFPDSNAEDIMIKAEEFLSDISNFKVIEFGRSCYYSLGKTYEYDISPQPVFNKNFDLLLQALSKNNQEGIKNILLASTTKQTERIIAILDDLCKNRDSYKNLDFTSVQLVLHEGFTDKTLKFACYTDHQLFERYQRFQLKDGFKNKESLAIRDFYELKPGDFVTHIDYGIGRFGGIEKIENNGKSQEAIRLIYKDNDILYVSIHSLHRLSKYSGKEGAEPALHRLGSNTWNNLKNKTKQKVKDIAKDLIRLYAERKAKNGFTFNPDTYLQHELEASFIYEDTPDQLKSTTDVKKDMEAHYPMDRLICGDVGFGKTEIAIRAAFKAVSDSKQVAILVPTTILALQHYKTFKDRLKEFPCNIDYINRFKSGKSQKEILKKLADGSLDIVIGTHRLIGKDIKFKDLGLLVIDEEQKFGVAAKEKLKHIKVNVDTLTLTATPIPRTLQFSLMGARDLSIINTPPANRYPIATELHVFNHELIRDAINDEVSRGGQIFFVHNRVQNIMDVAGLIQKLNPNVKITVGHGQMEGAQLEKVMLDFIDGDFDVLVATTIIESGLDIPNVNTIIINDAHMYGLSDLHQLRGRVGRSNKKAFCYLLAPPLSVLTDEARKRMKAIVEFSELGSGFNIAMRDLDIRGAGNLLGGEQSGFISEIGYETYQKILDDAIRELKRDEFKEEFAEEIREEPGRDCQVETDMEILIPDDYIESSRERMNIYKELDQAETEETLQKIILEMIDRFGPVPDITQDLFNIARLRQTAKSLRIEKIIFKNGLMICYFPSANNAAFYSSEIFNRILEYVKQHPKTCRMKEFKDKLSVTLSEVNTVMYGLEQLREMQIPV